MRYTQSNQQTVEKFDLFQPPWLYVLYAVIAILVLLILWLIWVKWGRDDEKRYRAEDSNNIFEKMWRDNDQKISEERKRWDRVKLQ